MARRKPAAVHGVLAIDKPAGLTSRALVNTVSRLLGERRCGHAGTLDPDATGVLVICFGDATTAVRWFTAAPKRYRTTLRFGEETSTDDAAGEPTRSAAVPDLRDPSVLERLRALMHRGPAELVEQVPPDVSALKRDGVRDHERVRRGEIVVREARTVLLYGAELVAVHPEVGEIEVLLDVGSGYYVRAFCRDVGRALGSAAHMRTLRRERCGGYATRMAPGHGRAITLDALQAMEDPARLDCIERLSSALGRVVPTWRAPDAEFVAMLRCGKRPLVPSAWLSDEHVGAGAMSPGEEADGGGFLVTDAADEAIAIVAASVPPEDWEPSGIAPDLRPEGDRGWQLQVVRGFPRPPEPIAEAVSP